MLSHLLSFVAGALIVYFLLRRNAASSASVTPEIAASAQSADPMCAPDLDLDAEIIAYISENEVFHINDVCRAIEHPKGARFVRAHFHQLMEQGKIRYRNMLYTI